NFAQDMTLSYSTNTISQSIFMYPHRTLKYVHLYSKNNEPLNIVVTVSQGEDIKTFTNIAKYQYKDGSFRLPIDMKIMSSNNLIIELRGNLDKIILSDNTLLGNLTSTPNQNLKISMTFYNNVSKEQYTLLYASIILLLIMFVIMVLILSESLYFAAFSIIYIYLIIQNIHTIPAAETISNFAYYAYHESIFTALRTSDAGYFPLIPRVVSLLLIKVFKVQELYASWTFVFSFFFGALTTSFFTLKIFHKIIPQNIIRLLMVFFIAVFVPKDVINIFNTPYWGMSILVLTPLLNKDKIPLWLYIVLLLMIPSIFLSKLLFLTIAPVYGIIFLYYIYQWFFKNNLQQKKLIFYTLALLGAMGQVIYYVFLSSGHSASIGNITTFTILYLLPNLARYILSPFKMNITDFKSLYMGLILSVLIFIFMYRVKNKDQITKNIWNPFILTLGLYVVFISILSSIRGWDQMYMTETRHTIIPLILTSLVYGIFLYKNIGLDNVWENLYFKYVSLFFIFIIIITSLIQTRYNASSFSYAEYSEIINNRENPYAILFSINKIPCLSLRYNTDQVGDWGQPTLSLTNIQQANAIFITGKKITEQLVVKGFDENGSNILILKEFIPSYKTVAYFKFGTNTNYFNELRIFNQNDTDKTKDLRFTLFTNINF
ncbi:MAG: hypothetical protein ACRCTJ_05335, partial [Brevinema sp.]